jgi:ABC-type sugar transport system ATPase subunit
MTKIELRNISKTFKGNVQAVKDLSLTINDGEFVVLVGPSGCGKTTILRMIAGLETITNGEILFDDIVVNNVEPSERNIGMVFQEYALYPHFTVYDNIAFPLNVFRKKRNHKLTKSEIKNRVLEVAEQLQLTELINRKPKELSGGQRQRVALGRALARKPKLFLFDEPLSNLDAKLRITLRQEIINLHKQLGITSIYVTHDQVEAMTMGSKIAILQEGVLQQFATPFEIYHNPQNLFVADFIGSPSINVFEGKVENGIFYETNSDVSIPFIDILPKAITPSDSSLFDKILKNIKAINYVAVRPEMLEISTNKANNRINISFVVDNVEFIGNESIIYFRTGNTPKRLICRPTQFIRTGQMINCNFALESLIFFNSNGDRIYYTE